MWPVELSLRCIIWVDVNAKNFFLISLQLDAFACPRLRVECRKMSERLRFTVLQLDDIKSTCSELQKKLEQNETNHMQLIAEQQLLHRQELEKGIDFTSLNSCIVYLSFILRFV